MLDSPVLSLGIGLIFIYLVLGLICTSINEGIASFLDLRAKTLEDGINNLFAADSKGDPKILDIAKELYDHPLVRGLAGKQGTASPSYIPGYIVSLVLIDLAHTGKEFPTKAEEFKTALQGSNFPPEVKRALLPLIAEAGDNLEHARHNIEVWYDVAMQRTSGWYKSKVQPIILFIALVLAISVNADTLSISNRLWKDPLLRQTLASAAKSAANENQSFGNGNGSSAEARANTSSMSFDTAIKTVESQSFTDILGWHNVPQTLEGWTQKVLGLIITAFAVSLGAPFWFDLLRKIVNVSGAGRSPDAKPLPPNTKPQPDARDVSDSTETPGDATADNTAGSTSTDVSTGEADSADSK